MNDGLAYRHQRVQRLRRLVAQRSFREAEGCFVAEGPNLVAEALEGGAPVESVYVDAGARDRHGELLERCFDAGLRVHDLARGVLARVGDTVNPQPVVAVVGRVDVGLDALAARPAGLVVVCAGVRDPGNAGTVLRSAEASGAAAVVYCEGSVDLYNPKTVRASAGALFHLPVVVGVGVAAVLEGLGESGVRRWATVARGGRDYAEVDLVGPGALILGNEASGLPDGIAGLVDERLSIPMGGRSESLNVGMAAAVICFEAARQRRAAAGAG